MKLNADFSKRASSHAGSAIWRASPSNGVERRMLDRIGDEVARATTIVRFAPDSVFPEHVHGGGEEYFVLEGDFVDEQGSHPAGTYVRNPPSSRHAPSAPNGATIFVKLNQFAPEDNAAVVADTARFQGTSGLRAAGIESFPLHVHKREKVRIEIWLPGVTVEHWGHGGLELLVLDGSFTAAGETFCRHSWLRLPPSEPFLGQAGGDGARLLVKSGHLSDVIGQDPC